MNLLIDFYTLHSHPHHHEHEQVDDDELDDGEVNDDSIYTGNDSTQHSVVFRYLHVEVNVVLVSLNWSSDSHSLLLFELLVNLQMH